MSKTKLKIAKVAHVNPSTSEKGFAARVITNGKAGYEEIIKEACHNTTLHKAEAKVALELCMESAANMLKEGMIVDLGPLGKLYPSCTSGWFEKAEDMKLSDVKLGLYFRPAEDVEAAIKGASIAWAKSGDNEDEEDPETPEEPGGDEPGSEEPSTVAAPTISGTTPFVNSTQVTITGPAEAEIRYTTDGTAPTAESTLYSASFALSDTAVVKAIAIKDGVSSAVTTKTFTKSTGGESD